MADVWTGGSALDTAREPSIPSGDATRDALAEQEDEKERGEEIGNIIGVTGLAGVAQSSSEFWARMF